MREPGNEQCWLATGCEGTKRQNGETSAIEALRQADEALEQYYGWHGEYTSRDPANRASELHIAAVAPRRSTRLSEKTAAHVRAGEHREAAQSVQGNRRRRPADLRDATNGSLSVDEADKARPEVRAQERDAVTPTETMAREAEALESARPVVRGGLNSGQTEITAEVGIGMEERREPVQLRTARSEDEIAARPEPTLQLTDDMIEEEQNKSKLVQKLCEAGQYRGMQVLREFGLVLLETARGR
jgi:hypothetical protein